MTRKLVFAASLMIIVVGMLGVASDLHVGYASPYTDVDVDTAYNMITNGSYPDLVVLDVRTQSEYDSGHIYGAVWIPHTELKPRISELAGHEDHEIIVYCRSGVRSVNASETLDSFNFTKVYNMLGGILAWESDGYPTWIATVHNLNTTLNYDTIQAAIDAPDTLDDHTILVGEGTYFEHVVVNKSLSLIGENREATIIDGNRTGDAVIIISNGTSLSNFTLQAPGFMTHALRLENVSGTTIVNNTLTNSFSSLILAFSDFNTIMGNNIAAGDYWSKLVNSSHNTLTENSVGGLYFSKSFNNTLAGNAVEAFRLSYSSNTKLRNNNISLFEVSGDIYSHFIQDIDSSNTLNGKPICYSVNRENAEVPSDAGYVALINSTNIIVKCLNLKNNYQGILMVYSSHNIIFHNNFINNTNQVYIYEPLLPHSNVWDDGYPSGGNYWSDYDGADLHHGPDQDLPGSDGIGDSEYKIDDNNQDDYPLMGMFSDFNATSENHVQTVCNSSISDLVFNGTAISFNVCGENGTTGFCRICIPTALMNETYRVLVNGTEILPAPLPLPCSNNTHTYLYFTYNHSTQKVVVIPEFPSTMLLPFLMISTLVAFVLRKKRGMKHQKRGG